jgi:hypothetical protein
VRRFIAGVAVGVTVGAWVYPLSEFITQAVLGHSPLDPKEL